MDNAKKKARLLDLAPIDTSQQQTHYYSQDITTVDVLAPDYLQPEETVEIFHETEKILSCASSVNTKISVEEETVAQISLFRRILADVIRVFMIIVPRPNPGIWTMENSMYTWTMRFKDDKIEKSYQWHVNKRYLRANRRFSWFLFFMSCGLIVYHWLVEPPGRFLAYLPCLIMMALPMFVCVIITYIRRRERYFVYLYLHLILTICLFITSFAWLAGQPLVLLILNDPLILDPMHTLLIFFIFNLAVTNLKYSMISTTVLIFTQCIICVSGLIANRRPFSSVFNYLVNDFLSLVLAYIFAFMCGRVRELYMRQVYLVRHFQKEEASILHSSRLKMEIMEEGMRAMKNQHPHVSPPSSPMLRYGPMHPPVLRHVVSEPVLPKFPPKAFLVNPALVDAPSLDVRDPRNVTSVETPLLRLMRSCHFEQSELPPITSEDENECDDLELPAEGADDNIKMLSPKSNQTQESKFTYRFSEDIMSGDGSTAADQNVFFSVLSELPQWILALPLALKSRNTRKSAWKRFSQYLKYKICMYAGEEKMEQGFQLFYNPISIARVKVLALSAIVGGVTITALNYVVQNYVLFEVLIRLAYMPLIAFTLYFAVGTKKAAANPRLCQSVILIGVYLLFVGYLLLVFDSHWVLRNAYSKLDPFNQVPSLNTPTNSVGGSAGFPWLPKSPFDVNVTTNPSFGDVTNVDWEQVARVLKSRPDYQDKFNISTPFDPKDFIAYQQEIVTEYIEAEARYMNHLNALTLFCCFAACSSGMRLVFFMIWKVCVLATLTIAASYATSVTGFDGQRVRIVIITVSVAIAGVWIARPLESEMRKWYQIKINYSL